MRRTIAPAITAVLATCALLGPAAPAQAAACANADAQPTAGNLAEMRSATLCLLNAERTPRGLTALVENARLTDASQSYSQLMVAQQFFAHVTPGGVNLTQRLTSVGYVSDGTSWVIGENLAWGTGGLATPARIMQAWMESPGHRENVLEPGFREVGIGIVVGSPNSRTAPAAATYTTDFGTIDGADAGSPAPAAPVSRTAKRKVKPRSCAALRRAKARGRISKASKKRLARCNRRARARARSARG
jgi:uncharacterized protein YkwD